MNIKRNLKYIWLAVSGLSMILLVFHWFGHEAENLQNSILALNSLALVLSLPCSLFAVPVLAAANYYLLMNPLSGDGMYLSTILLLIVGLMQWFWIARFWSPTESPFQSLDLINK